MTDSNGSGAFVVVVFIIGFLCGTQVALLVIPQANPVDDNVTDPTNIRPVRDSISPYIAVHLYTDHWVGYNGTVTVKVAGHEYSGTCRNGWFITSQCYPRGTAYAVCITRLIEVDSITLYGDFGVWKGSSWPYMVGQYVEVCHLNLTAIGFSQWDYL